jgi:hypothetical protein
MIITKLFGGLGNQMFQYVAGLSLAHHRRTTLKLDVSWFTESNATKRHERYGLDSFNLPAQFATQEEIDRIRGVNFTRIEQWSGRLAKALHFYQYAERYQSLGQLHSDSGFGYNPCFFDQPDNTYLSGNWQSERFFIPISEKIRSQFTLRYLPTVELSELETRIRSSPSAFLHVRRGDYVQDPRYAKEIGSLGTEYYQRALHYLYQQHPGLKVYVFSDDIDSVAKDIHFAHPYELVHEPADTDPCQILRLMALCDHAIISNSTFSWWGAWLNTSKQRLVIAPQPWFAEPTKKGDDIVPQRWMALPRFLTT